MTLRHAGTEIRYPLVIRRAIAHELKFRLPNTKIPGDMVLIPGGPFLSLAPRSRKLVSVDVADFAIARFPVTFAEYVEFLDALPPSEAVRRMPSPTDGEPTLIREDGRWRLSERMIEGAARARVPRERELELPATLMRWHDAVAYVRWRSERDGIAYRLPSDVEWEKAMRGADGRAFPMGNQLDPCFAKLRDSRPEPSQPEPIGAFPLDESPYGVRDLAGGIGDWTSTFVDGKPAPIAHDDDNPTEQDRQVYWRGGTWAHTSVGAMRYAQATRFASAWIGFRLAMSLDADRRSELVTSPMKRHT